MQDVRRGDSLTSRLSIIKKKHCDIQPSRSNDVALGEAQANKRLVASIVNLDIWCTIVSADLAEIGIQIGHLNYH
jgi:hypothetical protein